MLNFIGWLQFLVVLINHEDTYITNYCNPHCADLLVSARGKKSGINWISLEEAQRLNEKEPRKIIIDLYTSWCGWCKKMDASTFAHPVVAKYVNEKILCS